MGIKRVRAALTAAVNSAELVAGGLRLTCYAWTPDSVEVPCFYTGELENLEPNIDFGANNDSYIVVCRVLTSPNDDKAGQQALDDLLERGAVRKAINAARGAPGDNALSGACDDMKIVSIQGYRRYIVGTEAYFGAEIRVFIIGAGDGE